MVARTDLGSPGALPESWIPSIDLRLSFYVRIARITEEAELHAIEDELIDRFGPLPPEADALLAHAAIRLSARSLDIRWINAGAAGIALTPRKSFAADPQTAVLVEKDGRYLLLAPIDEHERIDRVRAVLEALSA